MKIKRHNIVGHKKPGICELHSAAYKIGKDAFWNLLSIRINYQLDAIEYLFTLARHVSGLHAHLQEQWML